MHWSDETVMVIWNVSRTVSWPQSLTNHWRRGVRNLWGRKVLQWFSFFFWRRRTFRPLRASSTYVSCVPSSISIGPAHIRSRACHTRGAPSPMATAAHSSNTLWAVKKCAASAPTRDGPELHLDAFTQAGALFCCTDTSDANESARLVKTSGSIRIAYTMTGPASQLV